MSPRTAKYVEAMIREGDSFDYTKWLRKVRQEEAQAKQEQAAMVAAAQVNNPISASDFRDRRPFTRRALISKAALGPRALGWQHRQAKSQTPKARQRRWLEKVHCAWGEFQGSRKRDGVYEYLAAVFAIVMHYKVRRRTNRLLRHAFAFANLRFDKKTDPFGAVIRCTSARDIANKTISKWSRALRFVARSKEPDMRLKKFMKEAGGVNACANRYAKRFGRGRRRDGVGVGRKRK
jgi:hypothetical protein